MQVLYYKPFIQKERVVVLVVMDAIVPCAVPPCPRVVGHCELLHGVGVDGSGLVHKDAAGGLVSRLVLTGKSSKILLWQ